MNHSRLAAWVLPLVLTSAAWAQPPEGSFQCRWKDGPITIDGKAEEPEWNAAGPGSELAVRPDEDDPRRVTVTASLPERAASRLPAGEVPSRQGQPLLTLRLVGEDGELGPPIFGRYSRKGRRLRFSPRYALTPGQRYRATLVLSGETTREDYVAPPAEAKQAPRVEAIYPSASRLPANLLKFYIHFSRPMREGKAIFEKLRLLDERGEEVPDPWRRTELWTPDAKRFTLWIHPGRIKRGVNLREEFGPVLEPGAEYTLVIEEGVSDVAGRTLGKAYTKTFRATSADDRRPAPQSWKLIPPRSGTKEALRIDFGEPLDAALSLRMLEVHDAQGRKVEGEARLEAEETRWQFEPAEPWSGGEHRLRVAPLLEDLAGNTPLRVFDTDLEDPAGEDPQLSLPFRPVGQSF